jgi:folate-dependent phosphoribosylglycinamide formyltransferase PurN
MNTLVIIGDHPRNIAFLQKLSEQKNINIKGLILFKREKLMPKADKKLSKNLKKLWKLHFNKRLLTERKYFNFKSKIVNNYSNILKISTEKNLNSKKVEKYLKKNKFESCFISGIPIIKKPLLKLLPKNTVNLHLGLIPNYKGLITMFWPFYFLEPTMAGTTYHIIDKYVDTGEILHNNVPKLKRGDGIHDVSCKAILSAHKDLPKIIKEIKKRLKYKIKPKINPTLRYSGKLFLKNEWKPEFLIVIYTLFKDKIVDAYLDKKISCPKPKLIQLK